MLTPAGVADRVRRLGWLCVWLVAKRSMRLWLTAPPSRPKMIVPPEPPDRPLSHGRMVPRQRRFLLADDPGAR
jgi:hypothetical protein